MWSGFLYVRTTGTWCASCCSLCVDFSFSGEQLAVWFVGCLLLSRRSSCPPIFAELVSVMNVVIKENYL